MTPVTIVRPDGIEQGQRTLAAEVPVAVEVNGIGYAVMMMTPADLGEFAVGFMLTERLADAAGDVIDSEAVETASGVILRVTLAERRASRIGDRVRHRTSDTGCGLCGIASLEQVQRTAPRARHPRIAPAAVFAALTAIRARQPGNAATGALHAAALCDRAGRIVTAFEDVGRHNALDKLVGAIAMRGLDVSDGFLLVTSRISFEMVDKALVSGAAMLVGVSAATSMALDHARAHRLTLGALARDDAWLVLNDPAGLFVETAAPRPA